MTASIRFVDVHGGARQPESWLARNTKHPFFAWAGLRAPIAQHTWAEHLALQKYVQGRRAVVEIGVAEGASAAGLREVMHPDGVLYLVDPFHLSRVRALNFLLRAAKRAVCHGPGAKTVWMESFSHDAVRDWKLPIDFLMIDGDHREEAVKRDWNDWHPFVARDGIVAFHDARIFANGWTSRDYGPVRFVERTFRKDDSSEWMIADEVDSLVFARRRDNGTE